MTYSHSLHGPHLVLSMTGNLHSQEYHSAIEAITSEHIENHEGNLILDFKSLEHINSSGLNLLLKLLNEYKLKNRSVIISGANTSVSGVLKITKLDTIFGLTSDVEAALKFNNRQTTANS